MADQTKAGFLDYLKGALHAAGQGAHDASNGAMAFMDWISGHPLDSLQGVKARLDAAYSSLTPDEKAYADNAAKAGDGTAVYGMMAHHFWNGLTGEQKRGFVTSGAEGVGATAGGIIGAETPVTPAGGAAIGGGMGHMIGNVVSNMAGFPSRPNSQAEVNGTIRAATGAGANELGGQALFNAIPAIGRATRNAVKAPFTPTVEQAAHNAVADSRGMYQTLAGRSGTQAGKVVDGLLGHFPTSEGVISAGRKRALGDLEREIATTQPSISPEEFQRTAKASVNTQRQALQADSQAAIDRAGQQLHPTPQSPLQGGESLVNEQAQASQRFIREAGQRYGQLEELGDDLPFRRNDVMMEAQALWHEMTPDAEAAFSPRMRNLLNAVNNGTATDAGVMYQRWTAKDAIQLRQEIARVLRSPARGKLDANALLKLQGSLDKGIGESFANADPTLAAEWDNTNEWYRENVRQISDAYNPAAKIVAKAGDGFPEDLVTKSQIVQPGADSRITQAYDSTHMAGEPEPAHGKFKRATFDQIVDKSQMPTPSGGERFSPNKYQRNIGDFGDGTLDAAFQKSAPAVKGVADQANNPIGPGTAGREDRLYNSGLGATVDAADPNRTVGEAFAKNAPEASLDARHTLSGTGDQDSVGQAAMGKLLEDSQRGYPEFGGERRLDPIALGKNVRDYGEAVPAAVGQPAADTLTDQLVPYGENMAQNDRAFRNTSQSGKVARALGYATTVAGGAGGAVAGHPALLLSALGAGAGANLAARAATSPSVVNWLTSAREPVLAGFHSVPGAGAPFHAATALTKNLYDYGREKQQSAPVATSDDPFDQILKQQPQQPQGDADPFDEILGGQSPSKKR